MVGVWSNLDELGVSPLGRAGGLRLEAADRCSLDPAGRSSLTHSRRRRGVGGAEGLCPFLSLRSSEALLRRNERERAMTTNTVTTTTTDISLAKLIPCPANVRRTGAGSGIDALAASIQAHGGWTGLAYYRLHGSPKIYYSAYGEAELDAWATAMQTGPAGQSTWCIFDNTASGAATGNALSLGKRLTSITDRGATTPGMARS